MKEDSKVTCPICGKRFMPRRNKRDGVQRCCSSGCGGKYKTLGRQLIPVTCASCGTPFFSRLRGKLGPQRFCSRECAGKGYSAQMGEKAVLEKRLLSRRRINAQTGCWEWSGQQNVHGYGKMRAAGRSSSPHRVSAYLYLNMPLDSDEFVCHTCDNRLCFNPAHLYRGDAKSNAADRESRQRSNTVKGAAHHYAVLKDEDVLGIIFLLGQGYSHQTISEWYHVARPTVSQISSGRTWGHLEAL